MISEVAIPVLDQTTESVALTGWLKREGDTVQAGEVVCEIETDKATVEIQAPASGRLRRILVQAGTQIPPRTVIALIAADDEVLREIDPFYRVVKAVGQSMAPERVPATAQSAPATAERPASQKQPVSPRARRLAEEHGIELAMLQGSGPGSRILEADVQEAVDRAAQAREQRAVRAKAERVSQSWQTIPHFYTTVKIDLTRIVAQQSGSNSGVTLTDHFAFAIGRALAAHPTLNGYWQSDALVMVPEMRLGLVVETVRGLVIPALADLRGRTLEQIAADRTSLVEQARAGKLPASALTSPTFTLSNMGAGHIDQFTAIINPPQVAVLSVGSVQLQPLADGSAIVVHPAATFTLGADHRAIDGRVAARFLEQLKSELEAAK